jgi:anion-transporting  ArsA/GET3 family ATPase
VEQIKDLLSHRLIIITGKGGVGRSTIAASLALVAARMDQEVLVVEWAPVEQMSRFFGTQEVGYEGGVLTPGIHGLNLDPQRAFKEYMLTLVRLESVYNKLFENQIIRDFRHFIPGLNDLMCMGKVYELTREIDPRTNRHKYDVVILDGPSSAQAIFMLQTPSRVKSIARVGPIQKHSRAITNLLEDPAQTALCVVTQAEELAVAEAEELIRAGREELNISLGPVVANAVPASILTQKEIKTLNGLRNPELPSNGHKTLEAWIHYACQAHRRAEIAKRQLARLRRKTSSPLITIPFVVDGYQEIERLREVADYILESG